VRRPATGVPEEWPSRGGNTAVQNPAYRLTGADEVPPSDKGGGTARFGAADSSIRTDC